VEAYERFEGDHKEFERRVERRVTKGSKITTLLLLLKAHD
jgi:hypothetical protein